MKQLLVIAALAFGGVVASPAPASASLMDWLQELSGPGPFHAKSANVILDACPSGPFVPKGQTNTHGIFASDYDELPGVSKPVICVFIDNRWLQNDGPTDNFGAGLVDVFTFEAGASVRVHRAISVGLGIGRIRFKSEAGGEPARLLVTAPRVVLKPAVLFGSAKFWDDRSTGVKILASLLKLYVKNNIIAGTLTGADFGLAPGTPNYNFQVSHDRVWSSGFVLDFSEVLSLL
jgi:hypothetical protein